MTFNKVRAAHYAGLTIYEADSDGHLIEWEAGSIDLGEDAFYARNRQHEFFTDLREATHHQIRQLERIIKEKHEEYVKAQEILRVVTSRLREIPVKGGPDGG